MAATEEWCRASSEPTIGERTVLGTSRKIGTYLGTSLALLQGSKRPLPRKPRKKNPKRVPGAPGAGVRKA